MTPDPGPRRPPDERLVQAVRDAIRDKRREGLIPTELRLSQDAWNRLSPAMRFAPFGGRRAMLLEGLPCVLSPTRPDGFSVHTIAPRED